MILQILMQVKRRGASASLEQLEQTEPDFASFVLENLSLLHSQLDELGGHRRATRRLYRQFEAFLVVCIESLRTAHLELWKSESKDTPLGAVHPEMTQDHNTDDEIDLHPPYGADDDHPTS
jgi:hypothetical protein